MCRIVEGELDSAGIEYEKINVVEEENMEILRQHCLDLNCDMPLEAPVVISGDVIVSGADCLVAIEEGDIE